VKATLERERKLTAPPGFLLPHLPGEPLAERELSSTYHDSPGLRDLERQPHGASYSTQIEVLSQSL